jgi:ABC-2 type transport system ATP-binding protein
MSTLPPPPPPPPAKRPARRSRRTLQAHIDPAFAVDATVEVETTSVWFGQKVALSELSCSFGPGVTGLLGPNGAGKTTLVRAITGLIPVNQGRVTIRGRNPRQDRSVYGELALVPEDEAVPIGLTPRQLCRYVAALHRIDDAAVVERALDTVELGPVADRSMDGFSKGMRQRSKVAAALVKDPAVLVLDEPLNGADPIQRLHLIDLFQRLGDEGRTIIVSSHVLHEVESMADRVIVIVRGRLAAAGTHRAIRDAMDDVPRQVLVRSDDGRRLAAALLDNEAVRGVTVEDGHLVVSTMRAGDLAVALPRAASELGIRLSEVRPLDDSLESLFRELVR